MLAHKSWSTRERADSSRPPRRLPRVTRAEPRRHLAGLPPPILPGCAAARAGHRKPGRRRGRRWRGFFFLSLLSFDGASDGNDGGGEVVGRRTRAAATLGSGEGLGRSGAPSPGSGGCVGSCRGWAGGGVRRPSWLLAAVARLTTTWAAGAHGAGGAGARRCGGDAPRRRLEALLHDGSVFRQWRRGAGAWAVLC